MSVQLQHEVPTDKQASYLLSLMERTPAHDGTDNSVAQSLRDKGVTPEQTIGKLNKRDASELIDFYVNQSSVVGVKNSEPPAGVHILDATLFKVQLSNSGNYYAKELVSAPGEKSRWAYVGRNANFFRLNDSTLMTLYQAQEYGVRTGVCAVCGRELTVAKSVERGIGPVCATRF